MSNLTFNDVNHFVLTWGLSLSFVIFLGLVSYALWPSNRKKFQDAAALPLEKDEDDGQ